MQTSSPEDESLGVDVVAQSDEVQDQHMHVLNQKLVALTDELARLKSSGSSTETKVSKLLPLYAIVLHVLYVHHVLFRAHYIPSGFYRRQTSKPQQANMMRLAQCVR